MHEYAPLTPQLTSIEGYTWPVMEPFLNGNDEEVVFYSLSLQRQEVLGVGRNKSTVWSHLYTHTQSEAFYLLSTEGLITLDMDKVQVNLQSQKIRLWSHLSERDQMKYAAIIPRHVPGFPPSAGGKNHAASFRIVENEILVGAPLKITGAFTPSAEKSTPLKLPGLSEFFKICYKQKDPKSPILAARSTRKRAGGDLSKEAEFFVRGNLACTSEASLVIDDPTPKVAEKKDASSTSTLRYAVSAGGVVFCLFALFKFKPFSMNQTNPRKPASISHSLILEHHNKCVQAIKSSCQYLIRHQQELNLPQKNIEYYLQMSRR